MIRIIHEAGSLTISEIDEYLRTRLGELMAQSWSTAVKFGQYTDFLMARGQRTIRVDEVMGYLLPEARIRLNDADYEYFVSNVVNRVNQWAGKNISQFSKKMIQVLGRHS